MEYVDFNAKVSPNRNCTNGSDVIVIRKNTISCCECGVSIERNCRNMCVSCLREHIDITTNISKQLELQHCKGCERYLQPPGEWINAKWESRELLGLCLKKIKGLKGLQLIDASFIWTERHSRRIKVKLLVEGNESDHASLRQGAIIEYTIQSQMCHDCHRVEAKDYWRCVVQVRQHAENKKTYLYLEQLILKHNAHEHTLGIKPRHGGLDFYFGSENHARKMVNFLESMVPVKVTSSRRLISQDHNSNIHHYRYTWSVEIAPLSKDSLVCLPPKVRHHLGNLAALSLVHRVTHGVHLIDPMSGQMSELSGLNFFRTPFEAICNPLQLVEFVVMDIEPIWGRAQNKFTDSPALCDVWLVRSSQLGTSDNCIHTRSHLGHVLGVGDTVLGYSMKEANINATEFDKLKADQIPDVLLVRKCYDRQERKRQWKIKHLTYGAVDDHLIKDKNDFLEDLEDDPEFRKNINVYPDLKKGSKQEAEGDSNDNLTNELSNNLSISLDFKTNCKDIEVKQAKS